MSKNKIIATVCICFAILFGGYFLIKKIRNKPVAVIEEDPLIFKFDSAGVDKCVDRDFYFEEIEINTIHDSSLMLNRHLELTPNLSWSADSFPVFNYESVAHKFHPGVYAERILSNVHDFNVTKDSLYYHRIMKYYKVLMENAVNIDSCLLFPNNYGFKLHGYKNQVMKTPWYSAFTQGVALSAISRLYKLTNDKKYLEAMHGIARSFTFLKADAAEHDNIWISCVDKDKDLWFEEYPQNYPGYTLNGKILAIFGLYEYYILTKDTEMKKYLLGGISTIKKNIAKYRMPGTISKYCLKHIANFDTVYHNIHIEQLHILGLITNDTLFENMSQNFRKDVYKK